MSPLSTEDGPFDIAGTNYQFIMDWSTTGHTGVDVPLTAIGPGGVVLTGLSTPVMLALLRGAGSFRADLLEAPYSA